MSLSHRLFPGAALAGPALAVPALLLTLASTVLCGPAVAGAVNINSADAPTIAQELKGIGLKRAQAIVEYRTKHGPFHSADELAQVKGIGAKVIQNNKADIKLDGSARPAAAAARPAVAAPGQKR